MTGFTRHIAIALSFCLLLAGCGGGGGGGGDTNPPAADTTPDTFTFNAVTGAARDAQITSNAVTIAGIDAAAPVSITGGEYAIDNGNWTSANGTLTNGKSIKVRLKSSNQFNTATSATLTIGGVSAAFKVTTESEDKTPAAFTFAPVTGAALNTVIESAAVTVSGINTPTPISITGGTYAVNGGAWTNVATVVNGATVRVRLTSSTNFETTTTAMLTIGGVSAPFSVTTIAPVAADTTPDAFTFAAITGAALDTAVESAAVAITGINAPASVTITGGEYAINDGEWTSGQGSVSAGQSIKLRVQSAAAFETAATATVMVGDVAATFSVTTAAEDATPNPFTFEAKSDVEPDSLVTSDPVTITGINSNSVVTITDGEYRIDDGNWASAQGLIGNNQSITVRLQSSTEFSTTTTATLSVGGVEADFSVTTRDDTEPEAFTFAAKTVDRFNEWVDSDPITISGITSPAEISISEGGEYRIGAGEWASQQGTVSNGAAVSVRVMSGNADETTTTTLSIGGVTADFSVTAIEDNEDPAIAIIFPVPDAVYDDRKNTFIVRGTADDDNEIASVTVNGVEATSADGFANWTATIPLEMGANIIDAVVEDAVGHSTFDGVEVERVAPLPVYIDHLTYDSISQRIYFNDDRLTTFGVGGVIRWFDPATGQIGDLANLNSLAMAFDAANNRLIYISGPLSVSMLDIASGNSRVITSNGMPGPMLAFSTQDSIAVHPDGSVAYITDRNRKAIIIVNLATGERGILSDDDDEGTAFGGGPAFQSPRGIAFHPDGDQLLVTDAGGDGSLYSVSLHPATRGNRTIVSGSGVAGTSGPALGTISGITIRGNSVYGVRNAVASASIVKVDLDSMDRTTVSLHTVVGGIPVAGTGLPFKELTRSIVHVPNTDRLFVAELTGGRFVSVDPEDGHRIHHSLVTRGTGPQIGYASTMQVDEGVIYLADSARRALLTIDPITGNRSVISDADHEGSEIGLGDSLDSVLGMAFVTNDILLTAGVERVAMVSLTNGQRTTLASSEGGEPPLGQLFGGALDDAGERFVVASSANVLFGVNLASGNHSVLSGLDQWSGTSSTVGSGLSFAGVRYVTKGPSPGHVYVTDSANRSLVAVNLSNGNRETFSDASPVVGSGPDLNGMSQVAWDPARARFVAHGGGQIYLIDANGNRSVLGGRNFMPWSEKPAIAVGNDGFYYLTENMTRLTMIDPETGERVIVSY